MKSIRRYVILSIVLIFSSIIPRVSIAADSLYLTALQPDLLHPRVEQAVKFTLQKYHYKNIAIDDSLSAQIFDRFIERLDFHRSYFLRKDIQSLKRYRLVLDDVLGKGNLDFAYEAYELFQKRFQERHEYVKKLLQKEFDFTIDEYYRPDRSDQPWAETTVQLDSIWQRRVKEEALRLKLTGKEWQDIAETLQKRYDTYLKNMQKSKSEDVFQAYMNAFAESYDPHTNYMSPSLSDDFRIRMSQSLEGIGASLRSENEYTKVIEVIAGGPADRSGLLKADDRIIGVGQGDGGELVDVIGWRIDDVVQLIRGPKSTIVRLQILPARASLNEPPRIIRIVRDKVKLSEQVAKSSIREIEHNGKKHRIGIIDIPSFYFDLEGMRSGDESFASTSRDVKRLIGELEKEGIDGLVIDLRDNGGGFLSEAIELSGLFIKEGPIVQVRNSDGSLKIERDRDGRVFYDGPMAVLVNGFSASASEIFAAALQDYGRAIVLGNQTYGKGTVQNLIPLNRLFPRSEEKYGQVKLTIAKFYRVSGGSTQHTGVIPDIILPSRWDHAEIGESSRKNALLWDEIDAVAYLKYASTLPVKIPVLQARHQARVQDDPQFNKLLQDIAEHERRKNEKLISLNYEQRKKQWEEAQRSKPSSDDEMDEDEAFIHEKDDDIFLVESTRILSDWVVLASPN